MSDFAVLGDAKPTNTAVPDPIPTGQYRLAITECGKVESDKSPWRGVRMKFVVQGGQHDGRSFTEVFTLHVEVGGGIKTQDQANDMIQRSKDALAGIVKAAGFKDPAAVNFSDVEGRRIIGNVSVKKDRDGNKQNQLKSWKPDSGGTSPNAPASTNNLPTSARNGNGVVDEGQDDGNTRPSSATGGAQELDDDLPF